MAGVGQQRVPPGPRRQLTNEELGVLKECNRESFLHRCVPLSAVAMVGSQYAITRGYLKKNPKYGSLFKLIGASVVGYIIGKISYVSECSDRLMRLRNSPLGEALRRRQQGLSPYSGESMALSDQTLDSNERASDAQMGLGGRGTWEINAGDNIDFQGMDDSQRPSMDNPMLMSEEDKTAQATATYDALRKRNREEYEARHTNIYDRNRNNVDQSRQQSPSTATTSSKMAVPSSSGARNKYGDLVD